MWSVYAVVVDSFDPGRGAPPPRAKAFQEVLWPFVDGRDASVLLANAASHHPLPSVTLAKEDAGRS